MLVKTFGSAIFGVEAATITVEVNIGGGFGYVMVGLPDNAVKESKERVFTAIRNNGMELPRQKITINMAPADIRKEGSAYDLTIAMGILAGSGQVLSDRLDKVVIMGELSLDGNLLPIKGALPIAIQARKEGFTTFILPKENAFEAAIVNQIDIIPAATLREAVDYLNGTLQIEPLVQNTRELFFDAQNSYTFLLSTTKG
jgi:magnesium chelatase family protein